MGKSDLLKEGLKGGLNGLLTPTSTAKKEEKKATGTAAEKQPKEKESTRSSFSLLHFSNRKEPECSSKQWEPITTRRSLFIPSSFTSIACWKQ